MSRSVRSTLLATLVAASALALLPVTSAGAAGVPRLGEAPFPSDVYTVRDASTPTGRRIAFPRAAMPANNKGKRIDPADWNRADGFSPGSTIVIRIPGLDTPAAFKRSGLVPITDIARSFAASQAAVVIDAKSGARQLIWTELDAQAKKAADRNLMIRPAKNFREGHRYIVALRNLRTATGRLIAAPKGVHPDPALLRTLKRAGIGARGLYRTWAFTVASEQSLAGRALHIRDDAFRSLGDTNLKDGRPDGHSPPFKVTDVKDFTPCDPAGCQKDAGQDPDLIRQVQGTFEVPCYLNRTGCVPGATFSLDKHGLPKRIAGNVMQARFVCNIPRVAWDGTTARRMLPALYGHGLLGDIGEARGSRNVHQLGNENGVMVCATDWIGLADEDTPSAARALLDLSTFPAIADRLQQGFLNNMFLARLLDRSDGLASDPAFHFSGQSVVDTSAVTYYGNSQGGILGGALTALSPDIRRSVLYVPGMNYSVLLPRSVDFDDPDTTADFAGILDLAYPSDRLRPTLLALIQMLWDRGDPDGYAQHMTSDPLPNTPSHTVLIEMSFGDHQVANITAETEARTIGAKRRSPGLDPGRSPDRTPQYGIPAIGGLPANGNAFVVWDIGPLRTQDGVSKGTPAPPTANLAPTIGQDPHDYVIENSPAIRRQIAEFLRPGGRLIDVCGGQPCRTPDWAGPGT